jgi:hypothetical protein
MQILTYPGHTEGSSQTETGLNGEKERDINIFISRRGIVNPILQIWQGIVAEHMMEPPLYGFSFDF